MWAKEVAEGQSYTDYNSALLARTLGTEIGNGKNHWGTGFGTFHEIVKLPSGKIYGSGDQLWTAASFINVCLRANIIDMPDSIPSR